MYSKTTVFILIEFISIVFAVYVVKDECPPNEEYLICGPSCPVNCTNYNELTSDSCITDCNEGCFCNPGYMRNENGTCVTPDKCGKTPTCGENEEFLTCGPACQPTCSEPEPGPCVEGCKMGCFCKVGFVKDEKTGKCVSVDNCPVEPCLNENETYDTCNAACEPTCSDPEPICNKICMGGCICQPGLLREGPNCVSIDKCGNTTDIGMLTRYLNAINKILHLN